MSPLFATFSSLTSTVAADGRRLTDRVGPWLARYGASLWIAALLLLAAWFIRRREKEVTEIWAVLRGADSRWLVAVVGIEAVLLILTALTYRSLLRRMGHEFGWLPLVGVHLQRMVVATITPFSGPASVAVFVRAMRRRHVPAPDALLTVTLRTVAAWGSFLVVLGPGLLFYHSSGLVLVAGAFVAAAYVLVGVALCATLGGKAMSPAWGRLRGLFPGRLRAWCGSVLARVRRHNLRPVDIARPLALSVASRIGGVVLLYASLRALGESPAPTTVLIAYVVGILALVAAPIFGGIGVVEAAVAIMLERLGVPAGIAFGAALLCRVGELWLPLAVGLAIQIVSPLRSRPPVSAPPRRSAPVRRTTPVWRRPPTAAKSSHAVSIAPSLRR